MKILFLLLFPVFGLAQNKGDNTIKLAAENYNTVKAVLFQNGYTLINNDTVFLTTSSKALKKVSESIKLMIIRNDTALLIKGLRKSTLELNLGGVESTSDFEELTYSGMKRSPIRRAWEEMDRIAKLISPHVTYLKQ